jgi:hypothetical protein
MLLRESLIDEHDGTVIVSMSQHSPDALIERSPRLLVVPLGTAHQATVSSRVVVAALFRDEWIFNVWIRNADANYRSSVGVREVYAFAYFTSADGE